MTHGEWRRDFVHSREITTRISIEEGKIPPLGSGRGRAYESFITSRLWKAGLFLKNFQKCTTPFCTSYPESVRMHLVEVRDRIRINQIHVPSSYSFNWPEGNDSKVSRSAGDHWSTWKNPRSESDKEVSRNFFPNLLFFALQSWASLSSQVKSSSHVISNHESGESGKHDNYWNIKPP